MTVSQVRRRLRHPTLAHLWRQEAHSLPSPMFILFPKPFLWPLRRGSQPLPHQYCHQGLSCRTPRNLDKPWGGGSWLSFSLLFEDAGGVSAVSWGTWSGLDGLSWSSGRDRSCPCADCPRTTRLGPLPTAPPVASTFPVRGAASGLEGPWRVTVIRPHMAPWSGPSWPARQGGGGGTGRGRLPCAQQLRPPLTPPPAWAPCSLAAVLGGLLLARPVPLPSPHQCRGCRWDRH